MGRKLSENEVKERISRFKELIKQGYSVRKALAESGLGRTLYEKYYDEIWSDPELKDLKPQPVIQKKPPEESRKEETIEDTLERLKKYGMGDEELTPLEREFMDLEEKRKKLLKAAQKIVMMYSPSPEQLEAEEAEKEEEEEKPRDPFEELEAAFKDFEERRKRIREILEKMGFKVEDTYMRRDEVEQMIEEVKRKAQEEALDDKRIAAVENIVRDAVSKLIELFRPAIDALFSPPQQQVPYAPPAPQPMPQPQPQPETQPQPRPEEPPVENVSKEVEPSREEPAQSGGEEPSIREESSESQES